MDIKRIPGLELGLSRLCSSRILESCLLEYLKVAKKLPKIQNLLPKSFYIIKKRQVNLRLYFLFFTVITNHANIGPEKWLEVSFKEMLAIMREILRVLNKLIIHTATIVFFGLRNIVMCLKVDNRIYKRIQENPFIIL